MQHPRLAVLVGFVDSKGLMNVGIFTELIEWACAAVPLGVQGYPTNENVQPASCLVSLVPVSVHSTLSFKLVIYGNRSEAGIVVLFVDLAPDHSG